MSIFIIPRLLEVPSLTLAKIHLKLDAKLKKILTTLTDNLKANPMAAISIISYPEHYEPYSLQTRRANNIRQYLMDWQGIGAGRINIHYTVGGGKPNVVDIESANY